MLDLVTERLIILTVTTDMGLINTVTTDMVLIDTVTTDMVLTGMVTTDMVLIDMDIIAMVITEVDLTAMGTITLVMILVTGTTATMTRGTRLPFLKNNRYNPDIYFQKQGQIIHDLLALCSFQNQSRNPLKAPAILS